MKRTWRKRGRRRKEGRKEEEGEERRRKEEDNMIAYNAYVSYLWNKIEFIRLLLVLHCHGDESHTLRTYTCTY